MSPSVMRKSGPVPSNAVQAKDYLRDILLLDPEKHDAIRVWSRFNELAAEGYALAGAATTGEMEALKVLGLYQDALQIVRFSSASEMRFGPDGKQQVVSMATVKGTFNGEEFLNADDSTGGFLDAIYKTVSKTVKGAYADAAMPEVTMYHVDSFRKEQNTSAPTRVTIGFSNGMTTQHIHTNQVFASFMALKAGFEMDLRKRKVTGMQPR
jgi:LeuA-like protein with dimerisation domain